MLFNTEQLKTLFTEIIYKNQNNLYGVNGLQFKLSLYVLKRPNLYRTSSYYVTCYKESYYSTQDGGVVPPNGDGKIRKRRKVGRPNIRAKN